MTIARIMDKIFSPIKDRVIKYLENKGIVKEDFYKSTGIAASNFKGKAAESEMGGDNIVKILSAYPDINPGWLMTGEGAMLKGYQFNTPPSHVAEPETLYLPKKKGIPLVNIEAVAGHGSSDFCIEEHNIIDYYVIPELNGASFLTRIRNNSMGEFYPAGALAACKLNKMQDGKVHVIATDQHGIIIKRIKINPENETITLISDNPEYKPFIIPSSSVRGIAQVIGLLRFDD